MALARHIAPPSYEMASKGTGKLDHWIREALGEGKSNRAGATRCSKASSAPRTRGPRAKKRE